MHFSERKIVSDKLTEKKDTELRRLLTKRQGCIVRPYTYNAPITNARFGEIEDAIVADVKDLRRMRD